MPRGRDRRVHEGSENYVDNRNVQKPSDKIETDDISGISLSDALNTVPNFDGYNITTSQFFRACYRASTLLSKKQMPLFLTMLHSKFHGQASQATLMHDFTSIRELEIFIRSRFNPGLNPFSVASKLCNEIKRNDEHIVDYINRVNDLHSDMIHVELGDRTELSQQDRTRIERNTTQSFFDGLPPPLRMKCQSLPHSNLAETFDSAIKAYNDYERDLEVFGPNAYSFYNPFTPVFNIPNSFDFTGYNTNQSTDVPNFHNNSCSTEPIQNSQTYIGTTSKHSETRKAFNSRELQRQNRKLKSKTFSNIEIPRNQIIQDKCTRNISTEFPQTIVNDEMNKQRIACHNFTAENSPCQHEKPNPLKQPSPAVGNLKTLDQNITNAVINSNTGSSEINDNNDDSKTSISNFNNFIDNNYSSNVIFINDCQTNRKQDQNNINTYFLKSNLDPFIVGNNRQSNEYTASSTLISCKDEINHPKSKETSNSNSSQLSSVETEIKSKMIENTEATPTNNKCLKRTNTHDKEKRTVMKQCDEILPDIERTQEIQLPCKPDDASRSNIYNDKTKTNEQMSQNISEYSRSNFIKKEKVYIKTRALNCSKTIKESLGKTIKISGRPRLSNSSIPNLKTARLTYFDFKHDNEKIRAKICRKEAKPICVENEANKQSIQGSEILGNSCFESINNDHTKGRNCESEITDKMFLTDISYEIINKQMNPDDTSRHFINNTESKRNSQSTRNISVNDTKVIEEEVISIEQDAYERPQISKIMLSERKTQLKSHNCYLSPKLDILYSYVAFRKERLLTRIVRNIDENVVISKNKPTPSDTPPPLIPKMSTATAACA